jgi:hypothetical protein
MSTDGTQPPSFAPKNPPAAPGRTSVRTPEKPGASAVDETTGPRPAVQDRPEPARPEPVDGTARTERVPTGGASARPAGARPAPARPAAEGPRTEAPAPAPAGPRRVRLAVARVDPWSVMKLSFLLSFAIGIMIVIASAVVWMTLDSMAVFTQLNTTIAEITGSETFFPLLDFVAFDRVMALATIIAIVDIVLLTALATIGAFLYNIVAALVGGIHLTLTDD